MTATRFAFGENITEDRGVIKAVTDVYRVTPGSVSITAALTDADVPAYGTPHPVYSGLTVTTKNASRDSSGAAVNVRVGYSDNPQTWRAAEPFNPLNDPGLTSWGVTYQRVEVDVPWAQTAIVDSPPGTPPTQYLAWQPRTETIGLTYTVFRLRTAIQGPSLAQIFQTGFIADKLHLVPVTDTQSAWMYYSPASIQQATQPTDGSPPLWTIDHEYWFDPGQVYDAAQLSGWDLEAGQNAVVINPGGGPIAMAKPYLPSSLPNAAGGRYARPPFERVNMVPSQAGIVPIADALTPPTFYGQIEKPTLATGYNFVLGVQ